MRKSKARGAESFTVLYERLARKLAKRGSQSLRMEYDDVLQELYVKLVELDHGRSAYTLSYVYSVLSNKIIDMSRKRRFEYTEYEDVHAVTYEYEELLTGVRAFVMARGTDRELSIFDALASRQYRTHSEVIKGLKMVRDTYYRYFKSLQITVNNFLTQSDKLGQSFV